MLVYSWNLPSFLKKKKTQQQPPFPATSPFHSPSSQLWMPSEAACATPKFRVTRRNRKINSPSVPHFSFFLFRMMLVPLLATPKIRSLLPPFLLRFLRSFLLCFCFVGLILHSPSFFFPSSRHLSHQRFSFSLACDCVPSDVYLIIHSFPSSLSLNLRCFFSKVLWSFAWLFLSQISRILSLAVSVFLTFAGVQHLQLTQISTRRPRPCLRCRSVSSCSHLPASLWSPLLL